jgi:hypothetical protein
MRVPAARTDALPRPAGEPAALMDPAVQWANSVGSERSRCPGSTHNTRMSRRTWRGCQAHPPHPGRPSRRTGRCTGAFGGGSCRSRARGSLSNLGSGYEAWRRRRQRAVPPIWRRQCPAGTSGGAVPNGRYRAAFSQPARRCRLPTIVTRCTRRTRFPRVRQHVPANIAAGSRSTVAAAFHQQCHGMSRHIRVDELFHGLLPRASAAWRPRWPARRARLRTGGRAGQSRLTVWRRTRWGRCARSGRGNRKPGHGCRPRRSTGVICR